jgi:hypothetical protein
VSVLVVALILVMALWAAWFVAKGLIYGVRLLRHPPAGAGLPPAPPLRDIAVVLLVGVGVVVIGAILATAAWVTESESRALGLHPPLPSLHHEAQL